MSAAVSGAATPPEEAETEPVAVVVRTHRILSRGRFFSVRDNEAFCAFCDALFTYAWDEESRRRVPARVIGWDCEILDWCGKCEDGAYTKRAAAVLRGLERACLPDAFAECSERYAVLERVHGDEAAVLRAEKYADDGRENLTLVGGTGAGKTSLVVYVAARRIERSEGVERFLFVSAFDLGIARRNAPLGEEAELVEEALKVGTLILDDVGSEPAAHAEVLAFVISKRHEGGLTTLTTTWMNADELVQRYGGGVARRILDRTTVIKLRGAK